MSSDKILKNELLGTGSSKALVPDAVAASGLGIKTGVKLLAIIAIIETLIMIGLPYLQLSPWADTALDTGLLTVFSGLCIWYFIIIPDRKIIQKSKEESIHFLKQHLQAIDEFAVVSTTDMAGRINYVNSNFCQISGYSSEELLGKKHNIVNSGVHSKEFFLDVWKTISNGKIWRGQICNRAKDGSLYWVDSNIIPIFNAENKITKYLSFRFDITSEKKIEQALEEEKIKNIHMSRLSSLGEMASGIAHEINNPLAIINGQMSIMVRKLKVLQSQESIPSIIESIEKSQTQVFRITKIINGLREFSRSGDDQNDEMIEIKSIFDAVEGLCFEKIKKAGVNFEFGSAKGELKCNPIQVEQVLVNLINNAVDAVVNLTDRWIKVEAHVVQGFVEISVTDSGTGIPAKIASKIMQPFFTTKEIGKGTGLGLSISHGIIKKYGGTLELDSNSKNTRFVVFLPISEASLMSLISIDDAIRSHLSWKKKTLDSFTESGPSLDVKKLSSDNLCALGAWIEKIHSRFEGHSQFQELKSAHTEFHICVGAIALRANQKDPSFSDSAMGDGSDYDKCSRRVIAALETFRASFEMKKAS